MYKVILKKDEEKDVLRGQDRVFANEVYKIEGEGKNGELCSVFDSQNRFIGKGFINHLSKILVTIFIRDENQDFNFELVTERLKKANDYRKILGYDNAYRAFFGNADGIPSLIVDKYGDYLCVQIQSLGLQKQKAIITQALLSVFSPKGIYERSNAHIVKKEGFEPINDFLYGQFPTKLTIVENGLSLNIDLKNGQKTGYFLDQKDNRLAVQKYAKKGVGIDCFCNVGGFALNMAKAGMDKVYALDISKEAIDSVEENAKMNNLQDKIEGVCCDVFDKLREYKQNGQTFDVVVLDPPAFCKSVAQVNEALKGYKDINLLGFKLVKSGGILVTSSCTHFVPFLMFENMLKECAIMSGRRAKVLEIKTQSSDHASLLNDEQTTYLKFYILQII